MSVVKTTTRMAFGLDQPRRIAHEGVTATVQAFCYNRDAPQSNELYRRFWVGSIPELLGKIGA
jgi:hypothetical protein